MVLLGRGVENSYSWGGIVDSIKGSVEGSGVKVLVLENEVTVILSRFWGNY